MAARVLLRTGDPRDAAAKLRELQPWTGCAAQAGRPEIGRVKLTLSSELLIGRDGWSKEVRSALP